MMDTPFPQPGPVGQIASRSVFRGRVLDVREDTVRYPDGSVGTLEVVRHQGAAAVLPIYRAGERGPGTATSVVLLRQYRYAAGGVLWEVPAGKLDSGERPELCARRELEEEAGLRAGRLHRLATLYTTPGFTDEVIHLYAATELGGGETRHEEHEFIQRHEMSLDQALELVRKGEIVDGKTVCSLLLATAFADLWDTDGGNSSASGGV